MKNYFIGLLIVFSVFLSSVIYKNSKISNLEKFPVKSEIQNEKDEPKLHLFLVFSKRNCHDCLGIIDVLNELPSQFIVVGIVPEKEMKNSVEIREITGAEFPLKPLKKVYLKFLPNYSPTIIGSDYRGKVYFVLPGVPNEKDYLEKFLTDFYSKAFTLLIPDEEN